jgi:aminobenzoyl-glutamate utilization protein B
MPLCDFVAPLNSVSTGGIGSTDVGDVSWVVPTVQARIATCAVGTPFHTWQTVAQGKAPAAHKGMVHAAKIMASTACTLINNPKKLNEAKEAFNKKIEKHAYICPIPDGTMPPIV